MILEGLWQIISINYLFILSYQWKTNEKSFNFYYKMLKVTHSFNHINVGERIEFKIEIISIILIRINESVEYSRVRKFILTSKKANFFMTIFFFCHFCLSMYSWMCVRKMRDEEPKRALTFDEKLYCRFNDVRIVFVFLFTLHFLSLVSLVVYIVVEENFRLIFTWSWY